MLRFGFKKLQIADNSKVAVYNSPSPIDAQNCVCLLLYFLLSLHSGLEFL